jgi:hypothetical protein
MTIKDSGKRSEFSTGAHRDCAEGKGRMDLLPFWAMMELSKVYEEGARKYRANNWRRGIPLSRFVDSGLRHLSKWMAGWRDEPHLAQAAWNFMCLLETQTMIEQGLLPESLNDLPYNPTEVLPNPMNIPPLAISDEGAELDNVGKEEKEKVEMDAWQGSHPRTADCKNPNSKPTFVIKDMPELESFKQLRDKLFAGFGERHAKEFKR